MTPRVLQVVLSLHPGGTERLVVELAARLNPTMPTAVCCLDEAGAWARELKDRGVDVHALGRTPGFHPGLGKAVAQVARHHRATVMHAHHYSPFVYSCLARLWRPSTQVVFTEHGRLSDHPPSRKRRVANGVLAAFPRRVFTVSAELGDHLAGEGFRKSDLGVIYNGIDIGPLPDACTRADVRQQLGAAAETFVIATVARLDPVKDLGALIRAVEILCKELPVMLVVVGDGPERSTLEQLTETLELTSHIRFLGQRDDARRWLAGCDAYVNCSISEGVSLTILEAMAAGLPVVATAVGGTPEVVEPSCGRLIPSRDVPALTAALRDLAADAATRAALGRAARARVETRFTLDRMVQEYRDVYAESTNGEGASRVRH